MPCGRKHTDVVDDPENWRPYIGYVLDKGEGVQRSFRTDKNERRNSTHSIREFYAGLLHLLHSVAMVRRPNKGEQQWKIHLNF